MKIDINPFETNFAELVFLTVNIVDVERGATYETITKKALTKLLAKFDNVIEKEKLNVESKTMPINTVNMS